MNTAGISRTYLSFYQSRAFSVLSTAHTSSGAHSNPSIQCMDTWSTFSGFECPGREFYRLRLPNDCSYTSPTSKILCCVQKKLYFMNEVSALTAKRENPTTFTTFNWPLKLFIIPHLTTVFARNLPEALTDHRWELNILTFTDTYIVLCSNPDRNIVEEVNENGITSRYHAFNFRIVSSKPKDQVYCDFLRSSNLNCWTINIKFTEGSFLLDLKWRFVVKINYRFHSNTNFHHKVTHGISFWRCYKNVYCQKLKHTD